MPGITISVPGVVKLLKDLNPHKAAGPDKLKPLVLKQMTDSLAPETTDGEETFRFSEIIELNVGGALFTTSVQTLTRCTESLLAAMFSGRTNVLPKDKHGRSFIDGDGVVFGHILNFLRNEELPPRDIAIKVYKAAVALELHEFIGTLERMPPVLQYTARENARSTIPGYRKFMDSFYDWIVDECKNCVIGKSAVYLSLFRKEPSKNSKFKLCETSQKTHVCFATETKTHHKVSADLYFGPWDTNCDMSESAMFEFMVLDVKEKGFDVIKYEAVGDGCEYNSSLKSTKPECDRLVFGLEIQWIEMPGI